jgi:c-di-GMP-binding flagellar brake protein YcgR
MLLETLNALNQAGSEALKTTCGLDVVGREVTMVREGRQSFASLATLKIRGCSLQLVHLGCDEALAERLGALAAPTAGLAGLDVLAGCFLEHLLDKFDERHPRGTLDSVQEKPVTLHTRGVQTFQFRLDTGQGHLFFLAEVPSRTEMAIAKGSEYLGSMGSIYLPADWHTCEELSGNEDIESLLTYLRKTEADIYLLTPTGDGTATMQSGLLVSACEVANRPALKFITDFADPATGVPAPGSEVVATVGVGDRSLEFLLTYLEPATHHLESGAALPCATFSLPGRVVVGQRRRTFRVSVAEPVRVELEPVLGGGEASPWADPEIEIETVSGHLADLSFSGARVIADHRRLCSKFQKGNRLICRMFFPELEEPLQVLGVIRRSTAGLADRNEWQDEIGLEFLVSPDGDRSAMDYVRQFVLQVQRAKLAQRLQVTGS